jgi:hypothetical protein
MFVQYLNREATTINFGIESFKFTCEGEVVEVPEKLGAYIISKYPRSYKKLDVEFKPDSLLVQRSEMNTEILAKRLQDLQPTEALEIKQENKKTRIKKVKA